MKRCHVATFVGIAVLVFLFAGTLHAQLTLGGITIQVSDASGASISGCEIKVKNVETGAIRQTQNDVSGTYSITALPAGRYQITASKAGFNATTTEVSVNVGQTVTATVQLSVGAVSQTVNVQASAAELALQKEDHTISQLISEEQISSLPMNGRNLLSIAVIGPGGQPGTDLINHTNNGGTAEYFKATPGLVILSGQSVGHTTFLQDGVSNVSLFTQAINILPSPDAVQEFSVDSNGMSAKFDQPSVVNIITKGGGNAFHGSAYDYFKNRVLNANSYFGNYNNLPKGVFQYNQFGGAIGGPIRKNKAFFFFNYEGLRNPTSSPFSARIPTLLERQGDFSEDLAGVPVGGNNVQKFIIYDPQTYDPDTQTIQPFPGNIIPSDRLSGFAQTFSQFWPTPESSIRPDGTNYRTNLPSTNRSDLYVAKVDFNLTSKDTLHGLYQHYKAPSISYSFVENLFGNTYDRRGQNAAIEETHVFSPTVLNVFKVGYNRSYFFNSQLGVGSQDWVSLFGLQNLNPALEQNSPPYVSITGCCGLGNPFAPQGAIQNRYQFADEIDWIVGKHRMSAGVDYSHVQFIGNWELVNSGFFTFNGQFTSNHGNTDPDGFQSGLGTADFMLGLPNFAWGSNGQTLADFRENDIGLYLQDDWKVTSKLTLNLGLRYQYYSPPRDARGNAATFDIAQNTAVPGSWDPNKRDFAPRVGFAYAVTPNTVIRSGYGIYYTTTPYNVLQFLMANPPNFLSQQFSFGITQPTPVSDLFPAFDGSSVFAPFAMRKDNPDAYLQQWNLDIQRTLPGDAVLSVAYVGNTGRHLSIRLNPNQASPDPDPLNPTPIQSRRPYPNVGDVNAQWPIGTSNYNALQTKLEKKFAQGASVLVAYTWSKSLDLLSTDGGDLANGLDPRRNYGPSDFDRTHKFNLSYTYELPFGPGRRFLNRSDVLSKYVLGGWQINGITTFASGQPFGVLGVDMSNTGGNHTFYADRVCDGNLPDSKRTQLKWFDTSCFVQPALGTLGNAGRNVLRMGGIKNWDFSLFKSFSLGESRAIEFRSEFFNLFNQHSFSLSEVTVNSPSYGEATGTTTDPRTIQFALKFLF
ncbi:MAG: TonB-dependent receptor [Acidobacteria bacterium]|nr:TonB-dependent receptor [Acidobacteriota bacterium]